MSNPISSEYVNKKCVFKKTNLFIRHLLSLEIFVSKLMMINDTVTSASCLQCVPCSFGRLYLKRQKRGRSKVYCMIASGMSGFKCITRNPAKCFQLSFQTFGVFSYTNSKLDKVVESSLWINSYMVEIKNI